MASHPHRRRLFALVLVAGLAALALSSARLAAQASDSARRLAPVVVTGAPAPPVAGPLSDVAGGIIYAGQKTERIQLDSLHANVALDITRQVVARIPGATVSEMATGGFPSNGIGFRGLDPTQSVEINTRQNGVNIAADLYGYPETYYTPPAEALDRIEVIRGAAALQFGPQFGGAVNYITRSGTPNSAPVLALRETGGSFGTVNSFTSVGGGTGPWTYYAYLQYRGADGWRPNSDYHQTAASAKLDYHLGDRLAVGLEYSLLRNRIHMPGGLSDAAFAEDPRQSLRARNWLASPWNIVALHVRGRVAPAVSVFATASLMRSQRYLVWRNEDGGAAAADGIDPLTGTYVPRELERERFDNVTTEARVEAGHRLFGRPQTLALGARLFAGTLGRQEGGPGSTGTDFDMRLAGGAYRSDLAFRTRAAAVFAQNVIRMSDRWTITPGVRLEALTSTARGRVDTVPVHPPAKTRSYPLLGLATALATGTVTTLYANVTQAYRPITYDALTPFASASRIDPHLRDASGYDADLGWRGSLGSLARFDVGAFYIRYDHRIGVASRTDPSGAPYTEITNVARSVHRGVESYVELTPFAALAPDSRLRDLSLFDAFAYVDARYVRGEFAGRRVEHAPPVVHRVGLAYARGGFGSTLQYSHTARSYADANNTVSSADAAVGVVPASDLLDWSASLSVHRRITVTLGVDNITNARYIAQRTSEYPGPGIIPGAARSIHVGIGATVR